MKPNKIKKEIIFSEVYGNRDVEADWFTKRAACQW